MVRYFVIICNNNLCYHHKGSSCNFASSVFRIQQNSCTNRTISALMNKGSILALSASFAPSFADDKLNELINLTFSELIKLIEEGYSRNSGWDVYRDALNPIWCMCIKGKSSELLNNCSFHNVQIVPVH